MQRSSLSDSGLCHAGAFGDGRGRRRVVVTNSVAGLGYGSFGIEAAKFAHLAVGLLFCGLVTVLTW